MHWDDPTNLTWVMPAEGCGRVTPTIEPFASGERLLFFSGTLVVAQGLPPRTSKGEE